MGRGEVGVTFICFLEAHPNFVFNTRVFFFFAVVIIQTIVVSHYVEICNRSLPMLKRNV
jgi:hypothetical protein